MSGHKMTMANGKYIGDAEWDPERGLYAGTVREHPDLHFYGKDYVEVILAFTECTAKIPEKRPERRYFEGYQPRQISRTIPAPTPSPRPRPQGKAVMRPFARKPSGPPPEPLKSETFFPLAWHEKTEQPKADTQALPKKKTDR